MTHRIKWRWAVVSIAVLGFLAGCDESSSSDKATEVTVGTQLNDSVEANGTNNYKFTTTDSGTYQVTIDAGIASAGSEPDFDSSNSYGCVTGTGIVSCTFLETLNGSSEYKFKVIEVSGADLGFTVLVELQP